MVEKKEEELGPFAEDPNENGVDLAHLRYNLSLTVAERIEKHRKAAQSVLYLKDVARRAGYRPSR